MKINQQIIFPTPLFEIEIPEIDNKKLSEDIYELRKSVAKYTSIKKSYSYSPDNVIIGPGSKELMFLLHVIFDGEIILPAPS